MLSKYSNVKGKYTKWNGQKLKVNIGTRKIDSGSCSVTSEVGGGRE